MFFNQAVNCWCSFARQPKRKTRFAYADDDDDADVAYADADANDEDSDGDDDYDDDDDDDAKDDGDDDSALAHASHPVCNVDFGIVAFSTAMSILNLLEHSWESSSAEQPVPKKLGVRLCARDANTLRKKAA